MMYLFIVSCSLYVMWNMMVEYNKRDNDTQAI